MGLLMRRAREQNSLPPATAKKIAANKAEIIKISNNIKYPAKHLTKSEMEDLTGKDLAKMKKEGLEAIEKLREKNAKLVSDFHKEAEEKNKKEIEAKKKADAKALGLEPSESKKVEESDEDEPVEKVKETKSKAKAKSKNRK